MKIKFIGVEEIKKGVVIIDGKFQRKVHSSEFFSGRFWVETTTGILLTFTPAQGVEVIA